MKGMEEKVKGMEEKGEGVETLRDRKKGQKKEVNLLKGETDSYTCN